MAGLATAALTLYLFDLGKAALAAKRTGDPGPLIVLGKEGPTDLDIRTALFCSDRDVVWQQLPDEVGQLETAVKEYGQVDVMMEKGTAAVLAREMELRPVAEARETELARVRRRH